MFIRYESLMEGERQERDKGDETERRRGGGK
jgi:hypothetical protein